jgi:hypothetical protein
VLLYAPGGARVLRMRRLTVARRRTREARASGGITKRARVSGKVSSTRAGRSATAAAGVVFGSTLKSLLQYAGVSLDKGATKRALRAISRFVEPVTSAISRMQGDREHLACGLLSLHVVPAQCRQLAESHEPEKARSYLARVGLKDVAVGVTIGVLVAHYVAAQSGADAEDIARALDEATANAEEHLENWRFCSEAEQHSAESVAALCAEARALARARAGARAAVRQAQMAGLDHAAALRLQLEAMRHAVFPPGVRCDAASHADLCETIASGKLVGDGAARAHEMVAPVPLSAIPSATWMSGSDCESDAASVSASSCSSRSSCSSAASSAASECGQAPMDVDLAAVAAQFRLR